MNWLHKGYVWSGKGGEHTLNKTGLPSLSPLSPPPPLSLLSPLSSVISHSLCSVYSRRETILILTCLLSWSSSILLIKLSLSLLNKQQQHSNINSNTNSSSSSSNFMLQFLRLIASVAFFSHLPQRRRRCRLNFTFFCKIFSATAKSQKMWKICRGFFLLKPFSTSKLGSFCQDLMQKLFLDLSNSKQTYHHFIGETNVEKSIK